MADLHCDLRLNVFPSIECAIKIILKELFKSISNECPEYTNFLDVPSMFILLIFLQFNINRAFVFRTWFVSYLKNQTVCYLSVFSHHTLPFLLWWGSWSIPYTLHLYFTRKTSLISEASQWFVSKTSLCFISEGIKLPRKGV